jgi:hypothetical protein
MITVLASRFSRRPRRSTYLPPPSRRQSLVARFLARDQASTSIL